MKICKTAQVVLDANEYDILVKAADLLENIDSELSDIDLIPTLIHNLYYDLDNLLLAFAPNYSTNEHIMEVE